MSLSSILKFIGATLILNLALACMSSRKNVSDAEARLSPETAAHAFDILKNLAYIPYQNTADSCHARALYQAMELAAQNIPSSSQYLHPEKELLQPKPGTEWSFHVATLIWIEGDQEPTIIDPSLLDGPALRTKWVQAANPTHVKAHLYYAIGSNYGFNVSIQEHPGPSHIEELAKNHQDMPAFKLDDIIHACRLLEIDIENEGQDPEAVSKLEDLYRASNRLLTELYKVGRLNTKAKTIRSSCSDLY